MPDWTAPDRQSRLNHRCRRRMQRFEPGTFAHLYSREYITGSLPGQSPRAPELLMAALASNSGQPMGSPHSHGVERQVPVIGTRRLRKAATSAGGCDRPLTKPERSLLSTESGIGRADGVSKVGIRWGAFSGVWIWRPFHPNSRGSRRMVKESDLYEI